MTLVRAGLVIALVSLGAAFMLALVSRAPQELRADRPSADAASPELGARFSDSQIERHAAYRTPAYLYLLLALVVEVVTLIVLARGPIANIAKRIENVPGGVILRSLILAALVVGLLTLASVPISFVRGYAMEHAWGLSTQDLSGWLSDQAKSLAVGAITAAVAAGVFFAIVRRQPRAWWLWGWLAFTVLTALMTYLWPVLIAPLFNRFTPLEDAVLAERITVVAADAGVRVDDVLVADASRRTTAENAYVAGFGSTKRVVLYDTLLNAGDADETMFVVAHELGHEVESHVLKNLAISAAGLLAGFLLLAWLAGRGALWSWGGASGIGDPRAIPILALLTVVGGLLVTPLASGVSRSFERRADEIALDLTEDPGAAVGLFRRLAFANIADLDPPAIARTLLFTHPPIRDRIRSALEHSPSSP